MDTPPKTNMATENHIKSPFFFKGDTSSTVLTVLLFFSLFVLRSFSVNDWGGIFPDARSLKEVKLPPLVHPETLWAAAKRCTLRHDAT